jgi:hypothetical protein
MTGLLGGQLESRLVSKAFYGLKQINQHKTQEEALTIASSLFSASGSYQSWTAIMGKHKNHEMYLTEIASYEDVAGKRWHELWTTAGRFTPRRVFIMGSSLKLCYSASKEHFKNLMIEQFGLSEDPDNSQSNILVEFFEDQYEEEQAAVKRLMGVFKKIAETLSWDGQRNAYPTSTFVCLSGRSFATSNFHNPIPEDQLRFWKEMRLWTEEHPTEKYLEFFRPTLLQATASNHISDRVRALLRDQPFLDGAMVILSKKLHLMLEDFTMDYSFDNPMRIQKATGIWAALMHHFVRALMMDLYSLPAEFMRQWTEIVVASQINRNLVNMGQWHCLADCRKRM